MLKLHVVPKTVLIYDKAGKRYSFQNWVHGCKTECQRHGTDKESYSKLVLLDMIIGNQDRHSNNAMVRKSGKFVAIDHGLSFAHEDNPRHFANPRGFMLGDQDLIDIPRSHKYLKRVVRSGELQKMLEQFVEPERVRAAITRAKVVLQNWNTTFRKPAEKIP